MMEVIAVARAVAILDAFKPGEAALTLGELARRTRLHKTTVRRIARTLAASRYLIQLINGSWKIGPASGWLGARYQMTFDPAATIEPILRELSQQTGESASFFVREGDVRTCLVRAEGPQTIRHHMRVGELLPLHLGAPGRVLLAFSGEPGTLYERIRRLGYHSTTGERDPQVGSVACPVLGTNQSLIGSLCVSGPIARFTPAAQRRHLRALRKAASALSFELSSTSLRGVRAVPAESLAPGSDRLVEASPHKTRD